MAIKTLTLRDLEADLKGTLDGCADSGDTVIIELGDQRLITIQSLDPADNDELVQELLDQNPKFRELITKSKQGSRKPFPLGHD